MASLRRSILGSIKSAVGDRLSRGSPKSSFRTDSSLSSRISSASTTTLTLSARHSRDPSEPRPDLDRQVDLEYTFSDVDKELLLDHIMDDDPWVYEQPCTILWPDICGGPDFEQDTFVQGNCTRLFTLPGNLRRKIYSYCFEEEPRKILLSPYFATKELFEDGYFASPWHVLEPVSGGLQSFRALRIDLMNYFWTQFCFHITLNMFSGPIFSPLSHIWLMDYLNIIQDLTLEVDLTRLGSSARKNAPVLGYDNKRVEKMVVDIVAGLLSREPSVPLARLHLMCRRYVGTRTFSSRQEGEYNEVPYIPHYSTRLCDQVMSLRGILQYCRISGFPRDYTIMLFCSLFGDDESAPVLETPDESAWPPVPLWVESRVLSSPYPVHPSPASSGTSRALSFSEGDEDDFTNFDSISETFSSASTFDTTIVGRVRSSGDSSTYLNRLFIGGFRRRGSMSICEDILDDTEGFDLTEALKDRTYDAIQCISENLQHPSLGLSNAHYVGAEPIDLEWTGIHRNHTEGSEGKYHIDIDVGDGELSFEEWKQLILNGGDKSKQVCTPSPDQFHSDTIQPTFNSETGMMSLDTVQAFSAGSDTVALTEPFPPFDQSSTALENPESHYLQNERTPKSSTDSRTSSKESHESSLVPFPSFDEDLAALEDGGKEIIRTPVRSPPKPTYTAFQRRHLLDIKHPLPPFTFPSLEAQRALLESEESQSLMTPSSPDTIDENSPLRESTSADIDDIRSQHGVGPATPNYVPDPVTRNETHLPGTQESRLSEKSTESTTDPLPSFVSELATFEEDFSLIPRASPQKSTLHEDSNKELSYRPLTPSKDSKDTTDLQASPNTMNMLNEQDPAFRRSLIALESPKANTKFSMLRSKSVLQTVNIFKSRIPVRTPSKPQPVLTQPSHTKPKIQPFSGKPKPKVPARFS